jgi:hypothetical protein
MSEQNATKAGFAIRLRGVRKSNDFGTRAAHSVQATAKEQREHAKRLSNTYPMLGP